MAVTLNTSSISINIDNVDKVISDQGHAITMTMVRALMSGLSEGLNFAQLADKHINNNLEQEISASDHKSQEIFQKLITQTLAHINENSPPLVQTFKMINLQKPNSAAQFVGSFVWPAAQEIRAKLPD
jgi:hypothetical protein